MKNKIFRLSLILLVGILTITGCKKGENDPFLSLLSRNARITGTWNLSAADYTETTTYTSSGTTFSSTTTHSYDGIIMTNVSTDEVTSYSYSWKIVIEKDGTFIGTIIQDGNTNETHGHWWWLEDTKDKTRIALEDDVNSFLIDQLKNKEMILTRDYSSKSTDTSGNYLEIVTTEKYTFEKE